MESALNYDIEKLFGEIEVVTSGGDPSKFSDDQLRLEGANWFERHDATQPAEQTPQRHRTVPNIGVISVKGIIQA